MLDRALSTLFRHFATCFLLVAALTMPLHVAVSYWHRDVIAVSDIHDDIAHFPDDRRVRGVGRAELNTFRVSEAILLVVELAALPVLIAATARVVEQDRAGIPPSIAGAWRRGLSGWARLRPRDPSLILAGAALGIAMILLARIGGLLLVEPLPREVAWAGSAVAEGTSRALGTPFFLVPAALATFSAKGENIN